MTDEEIRESLKNDLGVDDNFIDNFCEFNGMTLEEYRKWADRALAARRRDNPDYPKRKYDYN